MSERSTSELRPALTEFRGPVSQRFCNGYLTTYHRSVYPPNRLTQVEALVLFVMYTYNTLLMSKNVPRGIEIGIRVHIL